MIRGLKPYPAYKNSGLEWLGQVPEHWDIRRTKTILKERCEKGFPNEPLLAATQTKGVIRKEQYENRTVLALKNLQLMKLVEKGDFVISLRSFQGGIEYAHERGIISPSYTILYPRDAQNSAYLAFLFKSRPYIDNLQLFVTGIREGQNIDYERLRRSSLPLPPHPDQLAIVRFLDYMERRIRRVIRARKKRITLLEEYKEALIHKVVTGQFDVRTGKPYPAYKDSGLGWLGEVPVHWDVIPLKRLAWFKSGTGFPVQYQGDKHAEIPFFKVSDMNTPGNEKYLRVCANTVSKTVAQRLGATVFPEGTIVFPKVGGALLTNKRRITTNRCCIDNNMMACVPWDGNRDFLFLVMNYIDLGKIAQPGPVPAISEGEVREIRVMLPPPAEQTAIVEYLEAHTAKIDAAIAASRKEIELLREYRMRLISDVVTGKVDVREVAAQLPEEPAEEDEMNGDEIDEYEAEGGEADNETAETFFEEEGEP